MPSSDAASSSMGPALESLTFTFGLVTPLIMKAYRSDQQLSHEDTGKGTCKGTNKKKDRPITVKDFLPLSNHLQTQATFDAFEEMMISKGFLKQVPTELWQEMIHFILLKSSGGSDDDINNIASRGDRSLLLDIISGANGNYSRHENKSSSACASHLHSDGSDGEAPDDKYKHSSAAACIVVNPMPLTCISVNNNDDDGDAVAAADGQLVGITARGRGGGEEKTQLLKNGGGGERNNANINAVNKKGVSSHRGRGHVRRTASSSATSAILSEMHAIASSHHNKNAPKAGGKQQQQSTSYGTSASSTTASTTNEEWEEDGGGGVDGGDTEDYVIHQRFVQLPRHHRTEWARIAVHLSRDKARLFLSQDVSLFRLLARFISRHLALGMLLGASRTMAVMAQIIALWMLVRLANGGDAALPLSEWPTAYRCLLSLVLPIGAVVQSLSQHNTYQATMSGAIKARSIVLSLSFEKLSVMTPLYLGGGGGGGGGGAAKITSGDSEEKKKSDKQKQQKKTTASSSVSAVAAASHSTETTRSLTRSASETSLATFVGDGDEPLLKNASFSSASSSVSSSSTSTNTTKEQKKDSSFAKTIATVAATNPISTGKLVNIISSDANALQEAVLMGTLGLSTLMDVIACLLWVSILAGWATGILFAAMLAVFGFQVYCGYRVSANKLAVAAICDQRLRALTEFLSGIQVVKFYAWEANVRAMIKALRGKEAMLLVKGNSWKLIGLTSTFCAPGLFYLCLFGVRSTYTAEMDAVTTFTIMALLATNVNRTFQTLPRSLTVSGTAHASLSRVVAFVTKDVGTGLPIPTTTNTTTKTGASNKLRSRNSANASFSSSPAAAHHHHRRDKSPPSALHIKGDFGWPGFTLRGIDLRCPSSTLTVIMGPVGCGKSTLLHAVMGTCAAMSRDYALHHPSSTSSTSASSSSSQSPRIAYVAQEAFIAEATVRDNITFGLAFDEHKYRRVIKACSLVTDLQQWGGDLVEVSGNTLSGGQRQRLSLARACYADADLYVIDDPISAVDAAVGRHLLQKCFRGYLSHKTVLLTTHHPAPARFADQVVTMDSKGNIKVAANKEKSAVVEEGEETRTNEHQQQEVPSSPSSSSSAAAADSSPEEDALLDKLIGKSRALKIVEAEAIGSVPADVYLSYCKGGGWGLLLFTVVTFLISQSCRSGGDWWFSAWTSKRFANLSDEQYLAVLGCIVGATVFAACVRTLCFGLFTVKASSSLHDRMFEAVIASPLHFFEQVPLGRIMNRFSKDVDYCDDLLPRVLFDFIQLIFIVSGSLAMQIYAVPWFALAIPVALIIFALLLRIYMPASRYMKRIESTSRSPSMNAFQTVIAGLTTLRMYGRMADYRAVYYSYCDVTINAMLHSSCMQRWIAVRLDTISAMWSLCASLLCAALMFNMGGPSIVGLCLSQSVFLAGLFQFAVRNATETEMLMTSVERLDEYARLTAEENHGTALDAERFDEMAQKKGGHHHAALPPTRLPANWPAGCDITVDGLTVAHYSNPTVDVLKNLHFTIKAGQRVAVVGRTGAGKSTLLSAFFRTLSVPDHSIKIGGVSTTDIDVFSLRSKLGIIPQVPTLFHSTIRYNLDPFGVYTDMEMMGALTKVRLAEYVGARAGLNTPVGEGGGNLSVGQRQLLCAARVLLTGATILFMDEATANIDEETDAQIQQIMREEATRRQMIVITIAHRLNTVMDYDLVLVLSQGRLVEVGNPQDLVAAGIHSNINNEINAPSPSSSTTTTSKDFTVNPQCSDEYCAFAKMVRAMAMSHHDNGQE